MAAQANGTHSQRRAGDVIRAAPNRPTKGSTVIEKTASVHWESPGKEGKGPIGTGTGMRSPLDWT